MPYVRDPLTFAIGCSRSAESSRCLESDGRRASGTCFGLDGSLYLQRVSLQGASHPYNGLPAGFEFPRQGGDVRSFIQSLRNVSALIVCEARGPSERLAFGLCPAQASLRALDQEIAFELGDGVDDSHCQFAGRAGEIDPAQGQAMNSDSDIGELGGDATDVHGVAAEAIEFGDHQHVAGFQLVKEAGKTAALGCGDASGYRLGDDPARFDIEARGRDLLNLVLSRLASDRDTNIGKGARHIGFSSGKDAHNLLHAQNRIELFFGHLSGLCPKTIDSGRSLGTTGLRRVVSQGVV